MAEITDELVQRLDEISKKLDDVTEGFSKLADAINKLGEITESALNGLVNKIGDYQNMFSERSQENFDKSKSQLALINEEINKIRQGTGAEQLLNLSDSLSGILDLLGGDDFNPDNLKTKILEISKYIESKKGQEEG